MFREKGVNLNRRNLILSGAATYALLASSKSEAQDATTLDRLKRGAPTPVIKDIQLFDYNSGRGGGGNSLVKVITDQPGLYGYGCATFGQRPRIVRAAFEYLKPVVLNKPVDQIEGLWRKMWFSSYYKNDTAINCAISGVGDALWDINGRMAGMPVHQLVGGKIRDAAEVYVRAGTPENAQKLVSQGVRNLHSDFGATLASGKVIKDPDGNSAFEPRAACEEMLARMHGLHDKLPPGIKLGCDVHSKLDQYPDDALQFAIDLQSLPIFYLEDAISPENEEFYKIIRAKSSTPLAMGEMYNNPQEWRPLVENRTVDYIRNHVSHMGGFTAARKLADLCEQHQVKFAWHGSEDITPVGHMAGLTLDLVSPGFGIHEWQEYPDVTKSMFTGYKELKDGMAWRNDKPGWGIEFDEKEAAKHPIAAGPGNGSVGTRLFDGSVGP